MVRPRTTATAQIRAFFALALPEELKQEIRSWLESIEQQVPRTRWIKADNFHLSLKFLGELSPQRLSRLVGDLGPRLVAHAPITIRLAGTGMFPTPTRPRVVWLGGSAEGAAELARTVEDVAQRHGYARERRAFTLHLTLARLRQPWPPEAVERFLHAGSSLRLAPFVCDCVTLYSSVLTPTGAVYEVLRRLTLGREAGDEG